jgi:hypothetical protein
MVLCFKNYSDLLWEKKYLMDQTFKRFKAESWECSNVFSQSSEQFK